MSRRSATSLWYTVSSHADRNTVIAAYRGSLTVQRPRIDNFTIDVLSGEPWPAEVETAVAALRQRLEQRRDRRLLRLFALGADTVELDLEVDEDFALAVAIAPFTIGGTGISNGAIIWDGNDTGTSVAFDLTEDEHTQLMRYIAVHRGDHQSLIPLVT